MSTHSTSPLTSPNHSPHTHDGEPGFSTEDRRSLELRLLHHFTSTVTTTFPYANHPDTAYTWNVVAVELGFEFDFLLNALLALAALHIWKNLPLSGYFNSAEPERDYSSLKSRLIKDPKPLLGEFDPERVHRFYLNLAVSQQRDATANLCAENSNALILASVMLSYQAIGMLPEADHHRNGVYAPPTQWLRMTNAISSLSKASMRFIPTGAENAAHVLASTSAGTEPNFRDNSIMFNRENSKPFADLLNWDRYPEPALDADTVTVYEDALSLIGGIYRGLVEQETPRIIFRRLASMGALAPTRWIVFIEERRPRALAVLALFCALTKSVDHHWVFNGFAEREVRGIQSILPAEWQWAMEWPLTLLEKEYFLDVS